MRRHASAAIDVSDGLLADARHLAEASRLTLTLQLDRVPHSLTAMRWLAAHSDEAAARLELASSGDDYELLLATAQPEQLISELADAGLPATLAGWFGPGPGKVGVRLDGEVLSPRAWGFTHF
jgi:thiamine-monophosphate kinase